MLQIYFKSYYFAFFVAACSGMVHSAANTDGLRDHPIAGTSVMYLDGDWTASTTIMPPRPAICSFEENTDYNHGVNGPHTGASSQVHSHTCMHDGFVGCAC